MLPGIPSMITNGVLLPIVVTPLIRIEASAPGASPVLVTVTPAIAPCKASVTFVVFLSVTVFP